MDYTREHMNSLLLFAIAGYTLVNVIRWKLNAPPKLTELVFVYAILVLSCILFPLIQQNY